jgi:uncharacterized repeat protein (TIGR03803 family)
MLYGPTLYGGCNNSGSVFRISTDGKFDTVAWFNPAIAGSPTAGQLVVGLDQNIYGTTWAGDPYANGCIYRINVVQNNQPIYATWNGNSTIVISAAAVPGHTYQPQYTSTLSPANWQNFATPATATSNTLTFTDAPSDNQRFYRLLLLQ